MKENRVLKIISYISLPILIFIIVMSFVYTLAKQDYNYMMDNAYFESQKFAENYMNKLETLTNKLIYEQRLPDDYNNETRIFYDQYYESTLKNEYFLIIYKDKAITNVFSKSTIEEIKQYIMEQNGEKLISVNGKIKSNPLNQYLETYKSWLTHSYYNTNNEVEYTTEDKPVSTKTTIGYQTARFNDYEIYTTYSKEIELTNEEQFILGALKFIEPHEDIMYISIPICAVLTLAIAVYLIIAVGHTKGKKEIETNDFDKIPLEIILAIAWVIIYISVIIVDYIIRDYSSQEYYKLNLSSIVCLYLVIYTVCAISITTFIKRIKANKMVETTIIGKIITFISRIFKKLKKVSVEITISFSNAVKLILIVCIYIVAMVWVIAIFFNINILFGIFIDICITLYVIYQIIRRIKSFEMIEKQLKDIYEGNVDTKLDSKDFCKEFENTVNYINDISNGFENAIQEGIKSERLKTELITNVSHDIKTPLTSIINYVDLLKQENIDNEKAQEYINILEGKANRLKRLTEDLVEASKASSGNVKLNFEKIGIAELINQTTAEFEEKFKEKELEIITSFPDEEIYIRADSRYMYRIIENAFSNIAKYALKNSRVYIDVKTNLNKVNISIKNISAEKLNISEEELMQRFVRGDKSRTTEGSGLGLSIAKSLTELQKGKFVIRIDGDLFKVELEFNKVEA